MTCFCLKPCKSSSQSLEATKFITDSFNSLNNKNKLLRPRIKLINNTLDSLVLKDYAAENFYDMIDFNQDGKNDIIILIQKDYKIGSSTKPKNYKQVKKRILIVAEFVSNQNYKVKNIFNLLLNQDFEGLYSTMLMPNILNKTLIVREYGRQIDTDWTTDLEFKFDDIIKNWTLKKAIIYSSNIQEAGPKIRKVIKLESIKSKILIDSVDYNKYFPFGFSDKIPAN